MSMLTQGFVLLLMGLACGMAAVSLIRDGRRERRRPLIAYGVLILLLSVASVWFGGDVLYRRLTARSEVRVLTAESSRKVWGFRGIHTEVQTRELRDVPIRAGRFRWFDYGDEIEATLFYDESGSVLDAYGR